MIFFDFTFKYGWGTDLLGGKFRFPVEVEGKSLKNHTTYDINVNFV